VPFGIGGGAFGVRRGISTRGIGVGPFSAGSSWRGGSSGGGGAGLTAWLFVGAVIFFVTAWPFLLANRQTLDQPDVSGSITVGQPVSARGKHSDRSPSRRPKCGFRMCRWRHGGL
jgi:hypothetical protein